MKQELKHIIVSLNELKNELSAERKMKHNKSRLEADIIRYVHSIEKGLSIENPRLGFGVPKIMHLFSLAERYLKSEKDDVECLYFVSDAIKAYLDFHSDKNFENQDIKDVKDHYELLKKQLPDKKDIYGGTTQLSVSDMNFNVDEIEKLFNTRHSIREFSGECVDEETIRKAVKLAQRCPSACNRQGVRVYSVKGSDFVAGFEQSLDGIGGFAGAVDRFLLITGKKSAYTLHEKNQFIVSVSMFAAYLTLALHTYNIAACAIQRPLTATKPWENYKKAKGIPADEQLVMLIGIGKYKDKCTVPLSKRYETDKVYRNLDETNDK